ncbi:zinc-dependent alcohol dehydrogenase [Clostridium chauvoei]|uniref:Alcohol dehydrogenase catalytic domain-containing protein n=2 Tax=Clostridium chauvoei TaxID=46867 RepID=A0ABD4REM0_9CLOT|nr:zinc-binding dehydrogenase [Clostridium chauvoei]ATD55053.1 theronine dehydrogenase [Clostridium chauvoei]ATD57273.1 theronine dehydrogenase [Clostridium chauvoei]MBX7279396.1 alcohol dehydrogenase catalytic domain-containing protein [Clostridium chauvoei]MBX7282518.1 alcohol dehydrogenase catalytic domain-containing protein [Clostridium chauvoei]MBX7285594.1 alcohol dehydrogenase catalytic domain-containing protein [Clostridium chauvoei]
MEVNNINIEDIVKSIIREMTQQTEKSDLNTSKLNTNTSKVGMLIAKEEIEIKEFDIPEIGDDEILIKVEGCGICGTDVHEYRKDPFNIIPVVLGHEGTGEIIKIGKNINKDSAGVPLNIGDKIVTCIIPCGKCDVCLNHPEKTNLCDNQGIYGLISDDNIHLNGWFSEYLVLRKGSTIFNVSDMDLHSRLLIEPSAVVVHAVERAKSTGLLKFNSKVLVQGCGPIGLLLLSVLRTLGIENIIAVDGNEKRLEMAQKLGATKIINIMKNNSLEEVKNLSNGIGVDFAFQCTGSPKAASGIWKFIRRGGGLCEVGFFVDNGDATINPHFDICNKEITVVGSWVYTPQDYLTTFDFLKRAKGIGLPIKELITHEFPLEKLKEAIETNIKQEVIKIAIINK